LPGASGESPRQPGEKKCICKSSATNARQRALKCFQPVVSVNDLTVLIEGRVAGKGPKGGGKRKLRTSKKKICSMPLKKTPRLGKKKKSVRFPKGREKLAWKTPTTGGLPPGARRPSKGGRAFGGSGFDGGLGRRIEQGGFAVHRENPALAAGKKVYLTKKHFARHTGEHRLSVFSGAEPT